MKRTSMILAICLLFVAKAQAQVGSHYEYQINIVPKGDGPVLENKGISLDLRTLRRDDNLVGEVAITIAASISDENIRKNDKGIKKSKYKGNIYNVSSPIGTLTYEIRLHNGIVKTGTVEYPCNMKCSIRIPLGQTYKLEGFAPNLPATERIKKFVGQFGIAEFKVLDVATTPRGISKIENYIKQQGN